MHASERMLACCGGPLAAGLLVLTGMALASSSFNITAWMHNLLSYSYQHPIPKGSESDYGVVLGYALHKNGSCTHPLQSRVEVGVQLYQQGEVQRLVFSGAHPGAGVRNVSEANAMAAYALSLVTQQQQPPRGRWLLEELSTSTRTNAVYSLRLIAQQHQHQQHQQQQHQHQHQQQQQQLHDTDLQQIHVQQQQQQHHEQQAEQQQEYASERRVQHSGSSLQHQRQQQHHEYMQQAVTIVLVTNPFHQWRSYFTFRKAAEQAGMDVQLYVAAAPFAGHCGYGSAVLDGAMDQLDFWRELAAIAWYGLRGWL